MQFFPPDVSETGHWIDELFWTAFRLTSAIFLLVVALLVFMLVRYRHRTNRPALYTHGDSPRAKLVTLGLALAVFVGIDLNLAFRDHTAWENIWGKPPVAAQALRVEVMGEQFAWNIRYAGPDGQFKTADDVTTINQLHVPVNRPVLIQLSSKDVIHSFFLPNMRIKQDAMPGMVTHLYFQAKETGTYDIACAEHCGFGHYQMRGSVIVESAGDFSAWMTEQAQEPPDTEWGWDWS